VNSTTSKYEQSSKIHVLIANFTGIVAELITQAMQQQPDIELLGVVRQWHEVNALIGEVTIFVIGFEDETFSSETCLWLLNDHPQLKILLLRTDSDEGIVYWRTLNCQQMQIISAQVLIESIRHIHSLPYVDIRQFSSFLERN